MNAAAARRAKVPMIDGRSKPRPGPEEQSRAIIEAAVVLFLEQGSRSVSVMQICDRADVSRATFYRSFPDKKALLDHLYTVSVFEPVEHFMLASLKRGTSPRQMRATLDELFEAIFAQGRYADLVFRESHDPSSPAFAVVNAAFDKIVKAVQKSLSGKTGSPVDEIFLKSLLYANQWIAHDAIRRGLSLENKQSAKDAAWELLRNALRLDGQK